MTEDLLANIEVTPHEVSERLERGETFLLVDVREKWEHETSRIEGAVLIPLREIPANLQRLVGAREIVFFCHHGMRSQRAIALLQTLGFSRLGNLTGGIDAWSVLADPTMPRY